MAVACSSAQQQMAQPVHAFVQQVAAALASGNAVLACPAADQAELSGKVVQALLDAGIPGEILHFVSDRQVRKFATARSANRRNRLERAPG